MPKEGEVRIPSGCAISGIFSRDKSLINGSVIASSIKVMHERSNGLGGGFAGYGIYPQYKDYYAIHVFYDSLDSREECERFLDRHFDIINLSKIPTNPNSKIKDAPLIWRYFVTPLPHRLSDSHLDEDEYTVSSWNALLDALTAAENIAADDNASQEQVDDAANALNSAISALQAKASDAAMAALQNIVDKANVMQEGSLNDLIANAQALLDDPDNASVNALVSAMLDLSEAMAELNESTGTDALRQDLEATIDFINENILTNVDNIRPAKVQALRNAIMAAQVVLDDEEATEDQLKQANRALTKAAQELWEIVTKAELEALIEAANGYLDGDYTAESIAVLQDAITSAQAVADNDDATTAEVTDAITDLANAIAGLESVTLDTSALAHEIDLVSQMIANLDDYVPSTVEGFADKLADAQSVLASATSQEEIDAATKTLREARLNARTKADVSALEELIAYVNSLDLSAYTSASVAAMNVPYAKALVMIKNEEVTQEQVDELAEEMQAAIDALEPVNANVTSPNAGNADSSNNSTTAESANTAAVTQTGMMLALLAAAGAATLIIRRKRS